MKNDDEKRVTKWGPARGGEVERSQYGDLTHAEWVKAEKRWVREQTGQFLKVIERDGRVALARL